MLKLARNTKIIFIDENSDQRFIYCGWNNVWSLMHVLFARLGKTHEAAHEMYAAFDRMAEKGYLTPDECRENDYDEHPRWYWVVEKAIPKKYREDVYANKMSIEEIIKVLKV